MNVKLIGERASDFVADWAGSWTFVILYNITFTPAWIIANAIILRKPFDPYPFILLNLVFSYISSAMQPMIVMANKRNLERDRKITAHGIAVDESTLTIVEECKQTLETLKQKITDMEKDIETGY